MRCDAMRCDTMRCAIVAVTFACAGCAPESPQSGSHLQIADTLKKSLPVPNYPGIQEFDLGPILAGDRLLHHRFIFTNPTSLSLRVTGAVALAPCCSAVGPVACCAVPAGGRCQVPVALKVRTKRVETRRAAFLVQTNSGAFPQATFALRATLYPEWEIQPAQNEGAVCLAGRPGEETLRVVSRQPAGTPSPLLRVEAEPPLSAMFLGAPRFWSDAGDIQSTGQDVKVKLPASKNPGRHAGVITIHRCDGAQHEYRVFWSVVAAVSAAPANLILSQAEPDRTHRVQVSSRDGTGFRVTGVGPPGLVVDAKFAPGKCRAHTLCFRIPPGAVSGVARKRVDVYTDHPCQPVVSLGVYNVDFVH
jgi:hypothetical protein